MSVTIKAYLKLGSNANAEIRRFVVDEDACSNFEYISKKIMQVFPALATESFEMSWKDSEGDLIAFSSDEELLLALGNVDDIFRIYIQQQIGVPAPGEDDVHPGVTCDGCNSNIKGPRFKCVVCPNYDLCKKCEKRGVHSEHHFMKFRKPHHGKRNCQGQGFGGHHRGRWQGFSPFAMHAAFGGAHAGPFGAHSGAYGAHSGPFGPHRGPFGPHAGPFGGHAGPFAPPPPTAPFAPGPFGSNGGAPCGDKGPSEDKSSDEANREQQGTEDCNQNNGPYCDPNENQEDVLTNLGSAVADILEPFGIDVDVSVEHHGKNKKCKGKRGRKHPGHHGGNGGWWGYGGMYGPYGCGFEAFGGEGQQTGSTSNNDTTNDQNPGEKPANPKTGENGTTTEGGNNEPMDQDASNTSKQKDDDWMFVDESKRKDQTDGGSSSAGFVPDLQENGESQNEKVVDALRQMLAMGFTDEGGWLSRLLEAKGGNISKVLDTIKMGQQVNLSN